MMNTSNSTKSDHRLDASMMMRQNISRLQDCHKELLSNLDCLESANDDDGANVDERKRKRTIP